MARSDFFTKDKFIKGKPSFVETIGDYDVYLIKVKRRQYCPIEMSYYRCVIDGHEDWYVTLQHGKEAKAANFSHSVFSDIKQAREHIRYIVANKRIILTNEEWDKWVSKPNKTPNFTSFAIKVNGIFGNFVTSLEKKSTSFQC